MIRCSILVAVTSILFACGNKKDMTSASLKPEKMQQVMWDIFRAEAYTTQYYRSVGTKNDVLENARLQRQVFAIHKVSKEDFYQSLAYYKSNVELMKVMLDSMVNKAVREKSLHFKNIPKIEQIQ